MSAGESARVRATELRTEAQQLLADAEHWEAGAIGEERVAAVLDTLDRQTFKVLHDRLLDPGVAKVNLDHVVVCPAGIFLIDAKNWTGDVTHYDKSLWQHWHTAEGNRSANKDIALDSLRRMADEVRAGVNQAMKSLRADLAAGAREAKEDAKRFARETTPQDTAPDARGESRLALREAEIVLNEFRQQVRADLRQASMRDGIPAAAIGGLREGLSRVRSELLGKLGR